MAKKSPVTAKGPPGRLQKLVARLSFFGDTLSELKKAVWPTRKEVTNLTIMVIIVCVIVGIILGALDLGFYQLINNLFLGRP